VGSTAALAAR